MKKGFAPIIIVILAGTIFLSSGVFFVTRKINEPQKVDSETRALDLDKVQSPPASPDQSPLPSPDKLKKPNPTVSPSPTPNLGPTPSENVKLNSVDPKEQKISGVITLKGSGFNSQCNGQKCGTAYLLLASDPSKRYGLINSDQYWKDTQIDAQVFDVSKGDYKVAVMNWKNEWSNQLDFKVTVGKPVVDSITPDPVSEGGTITISGSELGSSSGTVYFNKPGEAWRFSTCAIDSWTDSKILCKLSSSIHKNVRYTIDFVTGDGRGSGGSYDINVK